MALFIDVARGRPVAAERRVWLEPLWSADRFCAYIARGLLAERALWQGDTGTALEEAGAAIRADTEEHEKPPWRCGTARRAAPDGPVCFTGPARARP